MRSLHVVMHDEVAEEKFIFHKSDFVVLDAFLYSPYDPRAEHRKNTQADRSRQPEYYNDAKG